MALSFATTPAPITHVTSSFHEACQLIDTLAARGLVTLDVATKAREVYLLCHGPKEFRLVKEHGKEMAARLLDKRLTARGFKTDAVEAWLWVWFAASDKVDARAALERVERALNKKVGY